MTAHPRSIDQTRGVLRCACGATDYEEDDARLRCRRCAATLRVEANIIDALPNPSPDVLDELTGMIREHGVQASPRAYMIREEPVIPFADLKALSARQTFDYYGSTELNFHQALAHVPITGRERVLEVGAVGDFPFLDVLRKKGCACFAANIHFWFDDEHADWPVRVVADMHDLPFADGAFDLVVYSACTHHGGPLDRVFQEAARVTKPGGYVIDVNEPIRGALKHIGKRVTKGRQEASYRNDLVHEHEYAIGEYLDAFRNAGLSVEQSLFSDYYDQRLRQGRVRGVRFAKLAKMVSALWTNDRFRTLVRQPALWLGQRTIGLQMNVVLRKPG